MSKHARLSPSNHRWPHCPGSIREEENYPDIPSDAAIDGTGSHLLLELCLVNNRSPISYLGEIIGVNHEDKSSGWVVKQDRVERVEICLEYIERRTQELVLKYGKYCNVDIFSETKSNPGKYVDREDWYGTCDITIVATNDSGMKFIEVIDYKDGRGYIDVKYNSQLIAYLFGKVGPVIDYIVECRMTIVQPKTNPPIRYQNLNSFEVEEYSLTINELAALTDNPDAPLIPDDKKGKGYCLWCKHNKNCEELKEKQMEVFTMIDKNLFEQISEAFKDIENLSDDVLSQLLDVKGVMDNIFKQAEEEIQRRIELGGSVPGYGMRPGNSKKEWDIEEEELVKLLKARKFKKDDIYISKLISPAQVLKHSLLTKQQKKKIEEDCIKNTPGKLTLRAVSRENNTEDPLDMFKDVVSQCNTEKISFL